MVQLLVKFNTGGDSSYPTKEDAHKDSLYIFENSFIIQQKSIRWSQ